MTLDENSTESVTTGRARNTEQRDPADLEALPTDPDSSRDLGYDLSDWERIGTDDDSGHLVFLPEDEEMLHDDAFVIVDEGDLCNLATKC